MSKNLSSLPVFEKREFFNADEFIKGTGWYLSSRKEKKTHSIID